MLDDGDDVKVEKEARKKRSTPRNSSATRRVVRAARANSKPCPKENYSQSDHSAAEDAQTVVPVDDVNGGNGDGNGNAYVSIAGSALLGALNSNKRILSSPSAVKKEKSSPSSAVKNENKTPLSVSGNGSSLKKPKTAHVSAATTPKPAASGSNSSKLLSSGSTDSGVSPATVEKVDAVLVKESFSKFAVEKDEVKKQLAAPTPNKADGDNANAESAKRARPVAESAPKAAESSDDDEQPVVKSGGAKNKKIVLDDEEEEEWDGEKSASDGAEESGDDSDAFIETSEDNDGTDESEGSDADSSEEEEEEEEYTSSKKRKAPVKKASPSGPAKKTVSMTVTPARQQVNEMTASFGAGTDSSSSKDSKESSPSVRKYENTKRASLELWPFLCDLYCCHVPLLLVH